MEIQQLSFLISTAFFRLDAPEAPRKQTKHPYQSDGEEWDQSSENINSQKQEDFNMLSSSIYFCAVKITRKKITFCEDLMKYFYI